MGTIGGGVCNETAKRRFYEVDWVNSGAVLNEEEIVFIGEHTSAMNDDGVSVETEGLTKWSVTSGSNPSNGLFLYFFWV